MYYGVPEATVVDLSFYMNPVNKVKTPQQYFSQVYTYTENLMIGYRQIYQVYEKEGKAKNRSISPAFNTLLTRVMSILAANGTKISEIKAVPKFVHRGDPIQYIQMDIVYTYPNHVSLGAKTTDREGAKGVNSAILEDEDMPVDDFGERADIVIAPAANINRMNFGQLYEHFLGCAQTTVLREIKHRYKTDYLSAWEYLLTFLYDVNSEYGKIADALHQNERRRRQLIEECIQLDYIPVVVPPGLSNLRPEWVLEMRDKYGIQATPVEYNIRNSDGELIRRVRTVRPVYIGRVYRYILCKIPHVRSCGMSYVNQFQVPITIKRTDLRNQYPIGIVPIRIGEDEVRNLCMTVGPAAYRLLAIHANSPRATEKLAQQLLTARKPTQLQWASVTDKELSEQNVMSQIAKHMLAVCGLDIADPIMSSTEVDNWNRFKQSL